MTERLSTWLAVCAAAGLFAAPAVADDVYWQGVSTQALIDDDEPDYDIVQATDGDDNLLYSTSTADNPPAGTITTDPGVEGAMPLWTKVYSFPDVSAYQSAGDLVVDRGEGDLYDLWDQGRVPTAGDTAVFNLRSSTSNGTFRSTVIENVEAAQVVNSWVDMPIIIDGAFDPDHMILAAGTWQRPSTGIQIQKDLNLLSLRLEQGYTTGTGPNVVVETGNVLTLSGENPLTFGGYQGGWQGLTVEDGATLRFDGADQTFDSYNDTYEHGSQGFGSARPMAGGGIVEFTNAAGVITLGDPGHVYGRNHGSGTGDTVAAAIALHAQQLRVHHETTWLNPSGVGAIQFRGSDGEMLIESIEGDPLDNMGEVSLIIRHSTGNSVVDMPAGTFRSMLLTGGATSGRTDQLRLAGDVHLTGGTGLPGDGDDSEVGTVATESDNSLVFANGNVYGTQIQINGHTLTTDRGILISKSGGNNTSQVALINAENSVLNVHGDLVFEEGSRPAGNLDGGGSLSEFRRVGILGDAGTVINLHGNFTTNSRSTTHGSGLFESTVNLLGGDGGSFVTYEVGSDSADDWTAGTFALGVVNVGDGANNAHVRLVNDFLNDNDADNVDKVKDGEVLLAGQLNIAAGSMLDLAGQGVKVGAAGLSIAGLLDLNTGLTLEADDVVDAFFGVGDQAATWNLFAGQVSDSSNAGMSFVAAYDGGDDATYWTAVPEPASLALLGLGSVLMLRRRRLA